MANVSFTTRGGKRVNFKTSGKKKRGKRKLSAYNRFAKTELKKQYKAGKSPGAAMRAVARKWKKKAKRG